jgi:O-antigen/teichoic acid export membrane protein
VIRRYLSAQSLPIIDQGLSSATNFLAVLAVARVLGVDDFGVFAMGYTVLTLFLGVSRSFFGIPIALAANAGAKAVTSLYQATISALLWISLPVAGIVLGVGLLSAVGAHGGLGVLAAIVLAAATPMVLMQDISRYYAISKGEPGAAVLSDLVWFSAVVLLLVFGRSLDQRALIVGWGVAVAISLAVVMVRFRPHLWANMGLQLLTPQRGLRESLALTVVLSTGVPLIMGFLMLPFLGQVAVGSLRGAGTLFGPLNTLTALLDFSLLGQLVKRDRTQDIKAVTVITAIFCALGGIWSLVLLTLPGNVGTLILGDTWMGTREILPITAVEYTFLSIAAGLSLILKLRNRAFALLINRVIASVTILGAVIVALLAGGSVPWMSASLLLGAVVSAVGMLWSTHRETRRATNLLNSSDD